MDTTQAIYQGQRSGENMVTATRKRRNFAPTYRRPRFVTQPSATGGPVMVCGPVPGVAELERYAQHGWTVHADGRYPVLRDRDSGTTVRWAAAWFGEGVTVDEADATWSALERWIGSVFGYGARPIGNPATTGRDLWLRSIPEGRAWPCVSPAVGAWIRSTGGQGRVELRPPASEVVPMLVEYDMRFAYAACLRELPIGEPVEWSGAFDPWKRGRYLVSWEAPDGWRAPGILRSAGDGGVSWPLSGSGWVDAVELDLAMRHGWRVEIEAGRVWDETGDPFRGWLRPFVDAYNTAGPRWRFALRSIVLHTIGAMFGADRSVTRMGDAPPADAEGLQLLTSGSWRWIEREPAVWPETHHPEWTTTVWARARTRLLSAPGVGQRTGALHVPDGCEVVAFRTDAVYLTADPGWLDDGAIGRFVHKRTVAGGAWPRSTAALMALRGGASNGEAE